MPQRDVVARQSGLVDGRHVGRGGQPGVGGDAKDLDIAAAHLRHGGDRIGDHHVDLARHQVLHRRSGAAIGHELQAAAGDILKYQAADVTDAALAGGADRAGPDWP